MRIITICLHFGKLNQQRYVFQLLTLRMRNVHARKVTQTESLFRVFIYDLNICSDYFILLCTFKFRDILQK